MRKVTFGFHSIKVPDQQGLPSDIDYLYYWFQSFHSIKVPDQQGQMPQILLNAGIAHVSIRSKSPTSRDTKGESQLTANNQVSIQSKSPTSRDTLCYRGVSYTKVSIRSKSPTSRDQGLGTCRVCNCDINVSIRSKSPTSRDRCYKKQ